MQHAASDEIVQLEIQYMEPGSTAPQSSFTFEWGRIRLQISGTAELIREGFDLLREEIMPKFEPVGIDSPDMPDDREGEEAEIKTRATAGDASQNSPTTAAAFYASKAPKSEQEKAIVLAYFAKKHREVKEFTVEQLETIFNDTHVPFKNVQNAIWNAARKTYGWVKVVPGKRKIYELTPAGESYVLTRLSTKA